MKSFEEFRYVNYFYVNLIMLNKVLFWIFVWFLKTHNTSHDESIPLLRNLDLTSAKLQNLILK